MFALRGQMSKNPSLVGAYLTEGTYTPTFVFLGPLSFGNRSGKSPHPHSQNLALKLELTQS